MYIFLEVLYYATILLLATVVESRQTKLTKWTTAVKVNATFSHEKY